MLRVEKRGLNIMVEDDAKRLEEGFGHNPVPEVYEEEEHKKEVMTSNSTGDAIDRVDEKKAVSTEPREVEQVKGAEEEQPLQVKQKGKRVATLDAFRGLTIVVCVLLLIRDMGDNTLSS